LSRPLKDAAIRDERLMSSSGSNRACVQKWTDARKRPPKLPFLPLFGTPGATARCQSSIGKSFRAKQIGPLMRVPGRSETLVGIGAPKLPHQFLLIVHYLRRLSIAPDPHGLALPGLTRFQRLESHVRVSISLLPAIPPCRHFLSAHDARTIAGSNETRPPEQTWQTSSRGSS
jgi:hypothetical protein